MERDASGGAFVARSAFDKLRLTLQMQSAADRNGVTLSL
jgi:hypothetical protein